MTDAPARGLAVGPANYAGQAHAWATAVSAHTPVPAWSFQRGPVRRGSFAFDASKTIPAPLFHLSLARGPRIRHLLRGTSHLALDGYQPFFRLFRSGVLGKDVGSLTRMGYQVALVAHGSDVRDPAQHLQREPFSHFREGDGSWRDAMAALSARNRAWADSLGLPLFVSTPDLLLDQPTATWLPVAVDVQRWAGPEDAGSRRVPRVLHLPSRRNPPIKGTQYVEPVLKELDLAGVIQWIEPTAVPHSQMPALIRSCDIVIDQLLIGSYGVAAVEAMAAGRVVIGRVSPDVAALMPEAPPIVDADPGTLESVIRGLAAEPSRIADLARLGVQFAQRWHSGLASARALAPFLGIDPPGRTPVRR